MTAPRNEARRVAAVLCARAGLIVAIVLGIGAVLTLGALPYVGEPAATLRLSATLAGLAAASWAAGRLLARLLR